MHSSFYKKVFSGTSTKKKPAQKSKDTIDLYILKLEDGRYYIGQSKHLGQRISMHFKSKGSAWTRTHKPIEVIETWDSGFTFWKDAEKEECKITLEFMVKYGWENVRGGFWSNVDAVDTYKNLLHHKQFIESLGFDFKEFIHAPN